jgi:hypothetical protein
MCRRSLFVDLPENRSSAICRFRTQPGALVFELGSSMLAKQRPRPPPRPQRLTQAIPCGQPFTIRDFSRHGRPVVTMLRKVDDKFGRDFGTQRIDTNASSNNVRESERRGHPSRYKCKNLLPNCPRYLVKPARAVATIAMAASG